MCTEFGCRARPSARSARGRVLRFLGPEALTTFLHKAGFVVDEQFGDWDRGPLTETSEEIITIARRVAQT